MTHRWHLLIVFLGLLLLAPTPGDVGGCGQEAKELDPPVFFATRDKIYCDACAECAFDTRVCDEACESADIPLEFPDGCVPLVHDGVVCLRVLAQASCSDFEGFVSEAPTVPTECNFCPLRGQ